MVENWPKIKARQITRVSPWMAIIEREVEFAPDAERELYHAVVQQDYIAIVAALPDSRIPIVRQYRPALESFTWELPAGLVEPGENAAACCRRELMEETGFAARAVHALGVLCALHGAPVEPGAFVLRRDRPDRRTQTSRAGNRAQAGELGAIGGADPCRRIRPAAPHWSCFTCGLAWLYRPRRLTWHSKVCLTSINAPRSDYGLERMALRMVIAAFAPRYAIPQLVQDDRGNGNRSTPRYDTPQPTTHARRLILQERDDGVGLIR
jgi:8-oxo-dGTP pyrophosphatase MutT (NUDIX family)